ncbi:MAG: VOC family protein [Proteobacteria bacterium]|nr:VOC family protein [Pseudomonadota bacterium]
MPRLSFILESSLNVEDTERSAAFYARVFGFERLHTDHHMIAVGVPGEQVLLLFRNGAMAQSVPAPGGGFIPPHDARGQTHLCFAIPFAEVDAWERHLADQGIEIESRVHWPAGGTSLYFRDPDGHSLEVATPGLWPNR